MADFLAHHSGMLTAGGMKLDLKATSALAWNTLSLILSAVFEFQESICFLSSKS